MISLAFNVIHDPNPVQTYFLTLLQREYTDPKRGVFSLPLLSDLLDHSLKKHSVRLMCS